MEYVLWWIERASWYGKLSFVKSREVDEVDESGNSMRDGIAGLHPPKRL